jgi:hypothetical protein
MPQENILPDELVQAAAALEKRLQILQVTSFKIPSANWESLPDDIRQPIPPWIPAFAFKLQFGRGEFAF